jgi:polyphosphate kinase
VAELSEGLEIRSIVDRFLEHSRIYNFFDGGRNAVYLASADWMSRNLNRRVEVAFPIYDEEIRRELLEELEIQLTDNTKSRLIDSDQSNRFVAGSDGTSVRAQYLTYERLKRPLEEPSE